MKRSFRLLPVLLAILLFLAACSPRKTVFGMERDGYRNSKTGVLYLPVSNFRAANYFADGLIGTYTSPSGNVTSFYRVEGMENAIADNDYQLYLAEGVSPLDFERLALESADLCYANAITYFYRSFNTASRLRDAITNGTALPVSRVNATVTERYDLVFNAADLPLKYRLIYRNYASEILIYEPLTADGGIPDLYPGVPAEKALNEAAGVEEAVFHFGTQLIYNPQTRLCYPIEKLTTEDN